MGLNAQTSVPTFTTGQVLTAAQQNNINTGIPVFADSTARDAAFGGTGEKVLAEGQFAYIETGNVTQYYDGASWVSVGVSGLTLISSTNLATGTTSVNNAFSATYDSYMLVFSNVYSAVSSACKWKLRAAGTDSSTGYYAHNNESAYSANTYGGLGQANVTELDGPMRQIQGTSNQTTGAVMYVHQPFQAARTTYSYLSAESNTVGRGIVIGSGFHSVTTSYDGFSLICSGSTWSGGTVKVFGIANS